MINVTRPSVASLKIELRASGKALGTATGFVVGGPPNRYLVTNRHVVRGRSNDGSEANLHPSSAWPETIVIAHHFAKNLGQWVQIEEPLYDTFGVPLWLEHPKYGGRVDVVALPLAHVDGIDFYPYDPINPGAALAIGIARPLFIVGFPFGVTGGGAFGVWVQGTVATELELDWGDLPSFLIDSRTRPGQSGSPVIAFHSGGAAAMEHGGTAIGSGQMERFIGVYSGRINEQSDLGRVWKKEVISDIVNGKTRGSA
jgi:hypothetical protein